MSTGAENKSLGVVPVGVYIRVSVINATREECYGSPVARPRLLSSAGAEIRARENCIELRLIFARDLLSRFPCENGYRGINLFIL